MILACTVGLFQSAARATITALIIVAAFITTCWLIIYGSFRAERKHATDTADARAEETAAMIASSDAVWTWWVKAHQLQDKDNA